MSISEMMRLKEHVECIRQLRNAYKMLVRTPEGKLQCNVEMNIKEMWCKGGLWISLFQVGTTGKFLQTR
jgi:hypothetical protein